jgi:hypothetical protein
LVRTPVRAQLARSHPILRVAGTAYVDLAAELQTARADAFETVWFSQRLSAACARHGWRTTASNSSVAGVTSG